MTAGEATAVLGARAALLEGLFDYAGLFPPAGLALPDAVASYLRHRRDPAARLLRRFVAPAARLAELPALLPPVAAEPTPVPLTVLVDDPAQAGTLAALRDHPRLAVAAVEARLAPGLAPQAAAESLADLARAFGAWPLAVEIAPPADGGAAGVSAAVGALAGRGLAAKLRCGGATADQVPTPAQVAGVIAACRDAGVALKLTAGLHHPIRGMGTAGGAPMHGFVNVVGAILLAWHHGLGAPDLARVIAETDPRAFRLDADAVGWRGCDVPAADVVRLRREAAPGLGTCSFEEPRDDLRALGWLT